MKKEDLDKIVVIQSKDLNDARYGNSYTVWEKKLILKLISTIEKSDSSFELKEISVHDLEFFNGEQSNYSKIHNVCKSIMQKPIEMNGLWCHWFINLGCKNGHIYYKFDDNLKKHLLNVGDKYNEFFLNNILNLKTYHSIRVYEILSLMINWNDSKDVFYRKVGWEDFKKFLNIEKSGYRPYDIKSKIIEKVKKEIELKTDIKFNYTINKKNKKYDYIDFVIMKNTK